MDHFVKLGCDPTSRVTRMMSMKSTNISLPGHLTSTLSFVFVAANLLLWLPLLLLGAILRVVLPLGIVKKMTYQMVEVVYRLAVSIDEFWFSRVLGIELQIVDNAEILGSLSHTDSLVVICNHQSWFDIFLLQTLISASGPILKFVIKAELLWVPVLGWICLALNFPRLDRKGDARSRAKDLSSVKSASLRLEEELGGLLIFPEGTRFSKEKRDQSLSRHQHLLRPKPGGFTVIQQAMPADTRLLDISIRYDRGDANCWRCMSGAVDKIVVKVESYQIRDIQNVPDWLGQRWSVKDAWLASPHKKRWAGDPNYSA